MQRVAALIMTVFLELFANISTLAALIPNAFRIRNILTKQLLESNALLLKTWRMANTDV
jgi:hypothetical protein